MQSKNLQTIIFIIFRDTLMFVQNFPLTANETMRDYYLQTCYIRVASGVAE